MVTKPQLSGGRMASVFFPARKNVGTLFYFKLKAKKSKSLEQSP